MCLLCLTNISYCSLLQIIADVNILVWKLVFRQQHNVGSRIIIVDTKHQQPESKQGREPYIPREVLRPLAGMIARRLLAERTGEAANGNAQSDVPETLEDLTIDLTGNAEVGQ